MAPSHALSSQPAPATCATCQTGLWGWGGGKTTYSLARKLVWLLREYGDTCEGWWATEPSKSQRNLSLRVSPLAIVLGDCMVIEWLFQNKQIQEETSERERVRERAVQPLLGRMLLSPK